MGDEGATSETPAGTGEVDVHAVLQGLVLPRARELLDAQIQDVDELATKALGVVGFGGVVLALLIGARNELSFWWVPVLLLVVASAFLLLTVWPQQELDSGPDPGAFYERFGAETRLVASEQMLAHLLSAFDGNAPKVARRTRFFNAGFVLLVLGLVASIAVVIVS